LSSDAHHPQQQVDAVSIWSRRKHADHGRVGDDETLDDCSISIDVDSIGVPASMFVLLAVSRPIPRPILRPILGFHYVDTAGHACNVRRGYDRSARRHRPNRRDHEGRGTIRTMIDHAPSPDRLQQLAVTLERIDLRTAGVVAEVRRRRAAVAAGHYLAPRLAEPSDTIVVAVVGPSGGGKSTIVNSMAGRRISEVGPMRPTTTEPVAWTGGAVPLTLNALRSRIPGGLADSLRPPPEGVVVVDTPPLDVVDSAGDPIVTQVLEVADAVIFVAGVTRYADSDAFALLELAAARRLPTVMVLNRLADSPEQHQVIATDFVTKLAARRLVPRADPELVATIAEGSISSDSGGLVPEAVARVTKDLEAWADPQSRPDIIAAVVEGSLIRLRDDLAAIRSYVIDSAVRRVELLDPMRSIYRGEARRLIAEVRGGKFSTLPADDLIDVLASAATRRAGLAARTCAEMWHESAPEMIERSPDLFGHGVDTLEAARERLAFWLAEIDDLPGRMGGRRWGRRKRRRLAEALRMSTIDPRYTPTRRTARRLERIPGIVDSARERLADELRGILATDEMRFSERLGPTVTGNTLSELSTGALS
jgi:energy-coupling factor transporter ATP-binding protein EcfA2